MTVISFSNRLTVLYFTAFSSKRNLEITQIAQITYAVFMHIILHRIHFKNFVRLLDYHQPLVYRLRPLVG